MSSWLFNVKKKKLSEPNIPFFLSGNLLSMTNTSSKDITGRGSWEAFEEMQGKQKDVLLVLQKATLPSFLVITYFWF